MGWFLVDFINPAVFCDTQASMHCVAHALSWFGKFSRFSLRLPNNGWFAVRQLLSIHTRRIQFRPHRKFTLASQPPICHRRYSGDCCVFPALLPHYRIHLQQVWFTQNLPRRTHAYGLTTNSWGRKSVRHGYVVVVDVLSQPFNAVAVFVRFFCSPVRSDSATSCAGHWRRIETVTNTLAPHLTSQTINYRLLRFERTKQIQCKVPCIDCFGASYHFINFSILALANVSSMCVFARANARECGKCVWSLLIYRAYLQIRLQFTFHYYSFYLPAYEMA